MKKLVLTLLSALTIAFVNQTNAAEPTNELPIRQYVKWMKKFIAYPEQASENNLNGTVIVSFEIGTDGEAENIIVENSVSNELNQKAVEMVKQMPKQHLYENGFDEGTRFVLPVQFKIQ